MVIQLFTRMLTRLVLFIVLLSARPVAPGAKWRRLTGENGLCVVGCTPYVDPYDKTSGILKYKAMVEEMAESCDAIVHVGDTKSGNTPCNGTIMTDAVHMLKKAAASKKKLVLYAPGDNEINDCFRHASQDTVKVASEFLKASDARQFLIDDLGLGESTDLTGHFKVQGHAKTGTIPGTTERYGCQFDKYVEFDEYSIATMEVTGSNYYLDDERNTGYPKQDEVDPLKDRLAMYLNANDCTLDWIDQTASAAHLAGKRALFFLFHASFYSDAGRLAKGSSALGSYYNVINLSEKTASIREKPIFSPYEPLFEKLTETAMEYPDIMFYVIHSDGHKFMTVRMNPTASNSANRLRSHHNLMIHQVEGASRALTMFTRFTVDPNSFQPVTLKQEWSEAAYNEQPRGHTWK